MKPYSIFHLGPISLVSLQEEINDAEIVMLLKELSQQVRIKRIRGVIVDLGNIDVIDTFLADSIQRLSSTMHLFKTKVVVSGLKASAILALKSFELTFGKDLIFALDTEAALKRRGNIIKQEGERQSKTRNNYK